MGCEKLKDVSFPSSLTYIGSYSFSLCNGLSSVTLPSNLTSVGYSAFMQCEGLKSVTLSPSLTFMGSGAFAECSNLSTLIIPSGLTSLSTLNEGSIFVDSGIKSVYVAWPTPVPAGLFFYGFDVSQSTLYVPQGTRQDYWVAAVWEDFGDIQEYEISAVNQPAHHSEVKEVSRYSLDDQRLTAPVKGLNIVRYSDGTIKKEAVL